MLTIIYGDEPQSIYNTNVYFKNTYDPEWFETELAQMKHRKSAFGIHQKRFFAAIIVSLQYSDRILVRRDIKK